MTHVKSLISVQYELIHNIKKYFGNPFHFDSNGSNHLNETFFKTNTTVVGKFYFEGVQAKCRDLEYEKRTTQKQIESLESQKKSLSEKYELVKVPSTTSFNQHNLVYLHTC